MARLKVGVLISGSGTNLQALIDDCARADAPSEIALVLSNRADAFGLTRAAEAGLPHRAIDHRDYGARADFERALSAALEASGVELVCLAGFMRVLTAAFVERWRDRLINVHPSLLPAFKGLDTHARAIAAGVRIAGCTVHFGRAEVDDGPIIGPGGGARPAGRYGGQPRGPRAGRGAPLLAARRAPHRRRPGLGRGRALRHRCAGAGRRTDQPRAGRVGAQEKGPEPSGLRALRDALADAASRRAWRSARPDPRCARGSAPSPRRWS